LLYVLTLALAAAVSGELSAQVQTEVPAPIPGAKPVTVEHIKVHGTALEGNLEGDAVDRDVFVFLPPGYNKHQQQRYPVVYALHGYSIGAEQWSHEIPDRLSRGLVGHSMGGYGATRIGMKHADVFGALYIMSPCCLSPNPAILSNPEVEKALESVKTPEDSAKLGFFPRAMLASAAAWSPDPKNPPLYLDLPIKNGELQPDVLAKWTANAPLAFIDQYIANLRRYRAIGIDVGDQDGLKADTGKLHDVLEKYGIASSFEIYPGTHTSRVADRFQNHVVPFFSKNLCFQADCR
jgi:enterochelin esterase-like enzyme